MLGFMIMKQVYSLDQVIVSRKYKLPNWRMTWKTENLTSTLNISLDGSFQRIANDTQEREIKSQGTEISWGRERGLRESGKEMRRGKPFIYRLKMTYVPRNLAPTLCISNRIG